MMEPADIIVADKVINFLYDTFVVMMGSNGAIMMKHICPYDVNKSTVALSHP